MIRLSLWALLVALATTFLQDAGIDGKWLIQVILQDNRRVPVFIVEIGAAAQNPQAKLKATAGTLDFKISRFQARDAGFALEVRSERGVITFEGRRSGDLLIGQVDGSGFNHLKFVAERTDSDRLASPQAPSRQERTDLQRAMALVDKKDRIAALKSFLRRNTQSQLKEVAYENIFIAHLDLKSSGDALLKAIEAYVLNSEDRPQALNSAASRLVGYGRELDQAALLSDRGLAELPKKSPFRSRFLRIRGQIALKRGNSQSAIERLKESLDLDPDHGETARLLAESFQAAGQPEKAQPLYLQAFLNSGSEVARIRLERSYRQAHGSTDGLHELIDAAYAERPAPVKVPSYQGPAPRRTVLVELFTGSECIPCQAADYAFDGLLAYLPEKSLVALQYHLHIPQPDPMAHPDAVERASYYGLHSTPGAVFSGVNRRIGGSRKRYAQAFFNDYVKRAESLLQSEPGADLTVLGRLDGDQLQYQASVVLRQPLGERPLRLRVALVESEVHYTGYNGVHFHRNVVRKMLGGAQGRTITLPPQDELGDEGGQGTFGMGGTLSMSALEDELRTYLLGYARERKIEFRELTDKIDRSRLHLAAFVQNEKTKDVLNAVMVPVRQDGR